METPLTHTSLLTQKHAVIFGASGEIGAGVAKEFAAQGATVFLSGRRLAAVERVAASIQQEGRLDESFVQSSCDLDPSRGIRL
jgi:3-oxoacyl-[acyl-carrier protein] reductase